MNLSIEQEIRLGRLLKHFDPGASLLSWRNNPLVLQLAREFSVTPEFLWRRSRTRAPRYAHKRTSYLGALRRTL